MSHRVSFKCTYTRHTPSPRGLGGLKRLPADRQTYKRRKYFLTFSFNKLSNFRSNKDKHSTHSSQKHALLCLAFLSSEKRPEKSKNVLFSLLYVLSVQDTFICNQRHKLWVNMYLVDSESAACLGSIMLQGGAY